VKWTGVRVWVVSTNFTNSSPSLIAHCGPNGPEMAERKVRGLPAASKLRTGVGDESEGRREREDGGNHVGAWGGTEEREGREASWRAPADPARRRETRGERRARDSETGGRSADARKEERRKGV
jgi:hypothetical protein